MLPCLFPEANDYCLMCWLDREVGRSFDNGRAGLILYVKKGCFPKKDEVIAPTYVLVRKRHLYFVDEFQDISESHYTLLTSL